MIRTSGRAAMAASAIPSVDSPSTRLTPRTAAGIPARTCEMLSTLLSVGMTTLTRRSRAVPNEGAKWRPRDRLNGLAGPGVSAASSSRTWPWPSSRTFDVGGMTNGSSDSLRDRRARSTAPACAVPGRSINTAFLPAAPARRKREPIPVYDFAARSNGIPTSSGSGRSLRAFTSTPSREVGRRACTSTSRYVPTRVFEGLV
ncbi:MAG: hypothetical protein QOI92_2725 [Chloroflexota bacterium]|nr:hypothetical protein [Chloroflexota bacterium]